MTGINNVKEKKEEKKKKSGKQLLSWWTSCCMLYCTCGTCGKACKLHKIPRFG